MNKLIFGAFQIPHPVPQETDGLTEYWAYIVAGIVLVIFVTIRSFTPGAPTRRASGATDGSGLLASVVVLYLVAIGLLALFGDK